jgi:GT2 family glycosyltransferase
MKISIIIVSWNVKSDLLNCLSSIKINKPHCSFEQIVVDNNSNDGTANIIKQQFPEVIFIENNENKGFSKANNQGIQRATGEYIFLLNPDTIVHPDALNILVDFLDKNPEAGACGPKLLNADGTIQPSVRRFPTFRGILYAHTFFRLMGLFRSQYKEWMMKDFNCDKQRNVEQIMGAAMMIRRSVIDTVGGMDENFFMYFEEVDLCYRIKEAGKQIVFLPDAIITHLGGRSSSQNPLRRVMMLKSMMLFFRKHRGAFATNLFAIIFKIAVIFRNISHLIIALFTFIIAKSRLDHLRMDKAKGKIRLHTLLLTKYLWQMIIM